jgi:lipopolysaccharide transport system permease protein
MRVLLKRDLAQRYRGSLLGWWWALLTPLLLLAVYSLVFQLVFRPHWASSQGTDSNYVLELFGGLIIAQLFGDVLSRSPRLIIDQPHLVKKVVFPLPLLAWITSFGALIQATLQSFVLMLAIIMTKSVHAASPIWVFSIIVLLSSLPMLLSAAWLLSALGVRLRDLQQIVPASISLLTFLAPIFYPLEALPEAIRPWVFINPITVPAEQLRRCLIGGAYPDFLLLASYFILGCLLAFCCGYWFASRKDSFADSL